MVPTPAPLPTGTSSRSSPPQSQVYRDAVSGAPLTTLPLEGRRAAVGGASQGIGRGCAASLAAAGATVTVMARNDAALQEVREALPRPADQDHRAISVDFARGKNARDVLLAAVAADGPMTVLINNTGGPSPGPMEVAEPAALAAAFEQHVLAYQGSVQAVLPGMIDAGYGRIINIISTSVVTPIRNLGVSNTIRAAVANWGRTLAAELGHHGVTVNNVLPGFIDTARLEASMTRRAELTGTPLDEMRKTITESVPVGRLGTPADIGAVVAFLASPAAAYVNGVNLPVDGGRLVALNI